MERNEMINMKIQKLYNDLQLLEEKHIYELDPVPGVPRCDTLALRMKKNLDAVVEELDRVE